MDKKKKLKSILTNAILVHTVWYTFVNRDETIFICLFRFLLVCLFWPHPQHVEVPGQGIKKEQ